MLRRKSFATKLISVVILLAFNSLYLPAATRQPLHAKSAVVACTRQLASQIGVDIMKQGGNAVDAAVAVGFALAVLWPPAGNIGGGGFLLIRLQDGSTEAIDYREVAPSSASRDMYLDAKGNVVPDLSVVGYKASGVPGTVAGLEMAWKRHGQLPWKTLLEPARKYAAEGFPIDSDLLSELNDYQPTLTQFPESKRIFLNKGTGFQEGDILRQPELAATIARIQQNGAAEFYEGQTAKLIAQDMQAHGGLITLEDLKSYKAVVRKPITGTYRGYEIVTMPPPSSGGIALIEMLNELEKFDLAKLGFHSADQVHVTTEAMRRAYADRANYLGDPDFVTIPTERLISKEYAQQIAATIQMDKATPSSNYNRNTTAANEKAQTTQYTIVDKDGNVASNTYTLNDGFGSRVTVPGIGMLMNNEMDDFTSKPGVPNLYGLIQGESNAIAPKKRPLSSMTPTIVLKDGKVFLALGSPGGGTIINTVLQTIVNVIDYGMNIQEAIDQPRFHHQWMPDAISVEPYALNADTARILEQRGHKLKSGYYSDDPHWGDAQVIMIDPKTGMRYGASDSRHAGAPAGY
jgi:gamma-glutamyltranspeptidase / glutathione hydrolase